MKTMKTKKTTKRETIDTKRALSHLMDLLAVEGLSGREGKVAAAIKKRAIAAGCKRSWIKTDDAHKKINEDYEMGNLIIQLPGTVRAPRRMLSGHMDTVPLCRGAVPVRKGGRIVSKGPTGLGGDNRTAVACMVTVLERILTEGLEHPPLTFLFTVGEEVGLKGARHVRPVDVGNPRLGFNIDGGDPADVVVGALGADRWEVEVIGRSAHAGVHPDHGVSATLIASMAIADVAAQGFFGKVRKRGRDRKLKTGTSNVGEIRGGEATNQVTDRVYLRGESRSHDPDFVSEITQAYRTAFEKAAKKVKNHKKVCGRIRFKARQDYRPFTLQRSAEVVRLTGAAVKDLGLKPRFISVDGGVDANHFNRRGIPTVTLGAGQHSPHTVDEYIVVDEYLNGCRLALALATG